MELIKNIVAGGKEIGKKVLKPAIGVAVAAGTAVALAVIGKKARQAEETEPETTNENETNEIEENEEENEEEEVSEENEEA